MLSFSLNVNIYIDKLKCDPSDQNQD